jgi:translation initiation factor IF-3
VRVIGENGEQLGVMPTIKALQSAIQVGLDLVEVAPTSVPPVCKILDYGRFKYEQTKKDRKVRQGQRTGLLKEIRVRPRVQQHDLETKIKLAKRMLEEGDKVKVNVVFRGREITHPELGLKALQKMTESLKDVAGIDGAPSLEGRLMNLVLTPISKVAKEAKQSKEAKETKEPRAAGSAKPAKESKVKEASVVAKT